jgi:amino acid adenylation domain-containing protein
MLSAAERRRLVVEWNAKGREFPSSQSIHQLFEVQAERTPDAPAVVFEGRQLTYGELNERANRLGRYLKRLGVGPDLSVGICMEQSLEMIVAMIGVLKAGGAYVPLDSSYPKERLAFMLRDCDAPVLITQQQFAGAFTDCRAKIIFLDKDEDKIGSEDQGNLIEAVAADHVAYVIYTSGSTGQPKGVMISHRAVNRLVINSDYVRLDATDVVAQASNVSFDAATFEIWGALLNGAKLVVIDKATLLSPAAFSDAIERQAITALFLTTALFNQMVRQAPAALGKLRYLLFGGESADAQRVRELLDQGRPEHLLHVYGPTETTTFASWYPVHTVATGATTVPIGRPIANTEIYILDGDLNPVPTGVNGELYIGGPGVARGYLNRPELTDEKFIAHPFSTVEGVRLYRTGDLARYLSDGNVEFVGRIDHQVKIRGFRIELGEIEAALNQYQAVRESVVLARDDHPGEKYLVAYVVPQPGAQVTAEKLRVVLRERLPEYMVPASYVVMAALPLTPNGKVDRKALPKPQSTGVNDSNGYRAPRTPMEARLAELWAEVLKVERVGIDENFWDIGGHSLVAVQLTSEMERRLNCGIPVALLFKLPTIAQLAEELEPQPRGQSGSILAVQLKGSMPPFFCVHGYAAYRHIARQLSPRWPFHGLGLHFGGRRVRRTRVEDQARAHLQEIYAVQPNGPYYLAGHSIGGMIAYEIAQLLRRDGHEVAFVGLIDTIAPQQRAASNWKLTDGVGKCRNQLARLNAAGSLGHLAKMIKASAQWRLKAAQCYGYHLTDRALPTDLLTFYVDELVFRRKYAKAQRRYRAQPYGGRVDYFRAAQGRNDVDEWQVLTNQRLVIHEIPGNHLTMIENDGAAELARSIKACLERAEAGR